MSDAKELRAKFDYHERQASASIDSGQREQAWCHFRQMCETAGKMRGGAEQDAFRRVRELQERMNNG